MQPSQIYSAPTKGVPVQYREIPEGHAGTQATIEVMADLARSGAHDQGIRTFSEAITRDLRNKDYMAEAEAIFRTVKENVRYTLDPRGLEYVQHPSHTLFVSGVGDCDDTSVLIAAMAISLGHGAAFRTVAADPSRPQEFSHVYPLIGLRIRGEERWVAADTTVNRSYLGWEPPAAQVIAVKTWVVVPA